MTDPPAPDDRAAIRHAENLAAVYRTLRNPPATKAHEARPGGHKARNTALGGAGAALAFLVGKLKFLGVLASVLKFKTLATMALSVGLYAIQWGWPFALGFVLLIFVHELGHAIVLRREGIPAGAPVFIPFVGALISMKGMPRDAFVEAKVALGGPVLGTLGAWTVLAYALATGNAMAFGLAHVGLLLNLFNLIPVSPLDGGRVAGAFTRGFWLAGYAIGVLALVVTRSPMLFLILLVGLFTLRQRWRHPVPGYDTIPRGQRLAIGACYLGLVVGIVWTMTLAHARATNPS